MKLVELKCNQCGAKLEVNSELKQITCQYCGNLILMDDEIQHIQYDNMGQSGYDFEMGRLKAQEDYNSKQRELVIEQRKKEQQARIAREQKAEQARVAREQTEKDRESNKIKKVNIVIIIGIVLTVMSCLLINPIPSLVSCILLIVAGRKYGIYLKQKKTYGIMQEINIAVIIVTLIAMFASK